MYESLRLIERFEEMRRSEFLANNWYDYNFIINDKIFEEPVSKKFDLDQSDILQKTAKEFDEDTSLYDVINDVDRLTITVDMQGIKKDKINLRITSDAIEITSDDSCREYYRFIRLPCEVKPESAEFSYKNGILDIVISKNRGIGIEKK
jgi:HSP20 family molecular chaperone IbpA